MFSFQKGLSHKRQCLAQAHNSDVEDWSLVSPCAKHYLELSSLGLCSLRRKGFFPSSSDLEFYLFLYNPPFLESLQDSACPTLFNFDAPQNPPYEALTSDPPGSSSLAFSSLGWAV